MSELIIKIDADVKDFNQKFDQVETKTKEINASMTKMAIGSTAAFAGLAYGIFKTTQSFKDSQASARQLETTLRNQGILSNDLIKAYKEQADSLKELTGIDDDVITGGQAILQQYLKQKTITKELTLAVLDFAEAKKLDATTAFELVGKAIQGNVGALSRYGIELDNAATSQQRLSQFVDIAQRNFKDFAANSEAAKDPIKRIKLDLEDLSKEVGRNLAPFLNEVAGGIRDITKEAAGSPALGRFIAQMTVLGTIGTGTVSAITSIGTALGGLNAIAVALEISLLPLLGTLGALAALGSIAFISFKDDLNLKQLPVDLKAAKDEAEALTKEIENLKVAAKLNPFSKSYQDDLETAQKRLEAIQKQIKMLSEEKAGPPVPAGLREKNKIIDEETEKKAAEELKKKREALSKDLANVGLNDLQILEKQRDERLAIVRKGSEDENKVWEDFFDKRDKLREESSKKEQADEKKAEDDRIRDANRANQRLKDLRSGISQVSGNPFADVIEPASLTPEEREKFNKSTNVGRLAGLGGLITQGAGGAKGFVSGAAGIGLTAAGLPPELAQAFLPILNALTSGPEATKAFVKEFTDAIPGLIQGLIEALPVFITELAKAAPKIIKTIADHAPEIITALADSMPDVAVALALAMPSVAFAFTEALIKQIPNIVGALIDEFKKSINVAHGVGDKLGIGGAGGGILGGGLGSLIGGAVLGPVGSVAGAIAGAFGFAEGGQGFVKTVPGGFPNDSFPARLQSGELVVDSTTAERLKAFLSRGGDDMIQVLSSKLDQLAEVMMMPQKTTHQITLNQKAFADLILEARRSGQRI